MVHAPQGRRGEVRRGEGEISKHISCWSKLQLIKYKTAALLERSHTIVFFSAYSFSVYQFEYLFRLSLPLSGWWTMTHYRLCVSVCVCVYVCVLLLLLFIPFFISHLTSLAGTVCLCEFVCILYYAYFILQQCVHHIMCKHSDGD